MVIKYLCTGYICTGSVLWGGTGYYLVVMWYESSTPDFVVVKQQSLSKIIFSYFLKNGSKRRGIVDNGSRLGRKWPVDPERPNACMHSRGVQ